MKRSETVGNGRQRSATFGNSRKHDQGKTCPTRISFQNKHFRATHFFLKVQRCPRGNGWKQSEIAPSLGKKDMFLHNFQTFFMNICYKTTTFLPSEGAISDCFQPFPLGHLWTFKKKCVARKCLFWKEMRVGQVLAWSCFRLFPTVADRCRPFPTVSDRFRPFHFFSERLIGPIPFMEAWSSANPCKPWRLSFFVRTLCVDTAPNIASWPWYPIFPKNHKIPGLVKFNIHTLHSTLYTLHSTIHTLHFTLHTLHCTP